jgi:hypothetical protein
MMRQEIQEQAEARLLKVIAKARFPVYEGIYGFEELSVGRFPNSVALACVRDAELWHQLVPISPQNSATERFKMFSFP